MSRPRSLLAHALPALGLSLLGPIGCGADTPPTSSAATAEQRDVVVEPEDQAGTDRAASEQRTVEGAVVDDPRGETTGGAITVTSPTTSAATPVASLTLVRLLDVDAEDGRGTSARAARAKSTPIGESDRKSSSRVCSASGGAESSRTEYRKNSADGPSTKDIVGP
jgi:hypothetical protein